MYTHRDHENALLYARERLRQERIYRKRQAEPGPYAFVEIEDLGTAGWHDKLGLVVEPGQKLCPYYDIKYDRSKARCEDFSCIPFDPRPGEDSQPRPCKFGEEIDFPVTGKDGKVIKVLSACGPGCYRLAKKRDPETGLPVPVGTLVTPHADAEGNYTCRYANTNLILWASLPVTRISSNGKVMEGYNSEHVPPFGFGEPDLRTVHLTDSYCRFFKQYFDSDSEECYRTGWMKTVRFMFGTYFTNLAYEMANPEAADEAFPPSLTPISPLTYSLGRALYAAGAARTKEAVHLRPRKFDAAATPVVERASPDETDKDMARRLARSHFAPYLADPAAAEKITESIVEYVRANESRPERIASAPAESATEELVSALLDAAFKLEVFKLSDSEARSALLGCLLRHKGVRKLGGDLGPGCRLIGLVLKMRRVLFSEEARRRRKTGAGSGRRDCASGVSELEALRYAEIALAGDRFVDVFEGPPVDPEDAVREIWHRTFSSYAVRGIEWTGNLLKSIVVNTVRGVLDILEGKIFDKDYDFAGNLPMYVGVDALLRTVLESAAGACSRFAAEYGAATVASRAAIVMSERLMADVATRTFGFAVESAVVAMVVSMAARLALDVFVQLAALASAAINVVGWVLLVGAVVGLVLDLALGLDWYNNVMTKEQLGRHVAAYEAAFANATDTASGDLVPVSPEELLSLAVTWDAREAGREERGTLKDFLASYFGQTPMGKSAVAFLQEAQFEYLGGRRVNSLGQPLRPDVAGERARREHAATVGRKTMVETATAVANYARVVQFNAGRIDLLHAMDRKPVPAGLLDSTRFDDTLRLCGVGCAAAAGLALGCGIGRTALSPREARRGLLGVVFFFVFSVVAYAFFKAVGRRNVLRAQHFGVPARVDETGVLSHNAAKRRANAKVRVMKSFMDPFFKRILLT